jgi:hypothetical protein
MFNKSKIALSVAIVLATASGAFAATKHHGHGHSKVDARVAASAFGANASVGGNGGRTVSSGAMLIQDRDWSSQIGGNSNCGGKC